VERLESWDCTPIPFPKLLKEQCDHFKPLYVLVESVFLQSAIVRACRQIHGMPAIRAVDPGGKTKLMRAVRLVPG
jgi:hypothetical protein